VAIILPHPPQEITAGCDPGSAYLSVSPFLFIFYRETLLPIQVQQRSRNAGLGMRGLSYGLDAGDMSDYRTAAKKLTYMRYLETE